MRIMEDEAGLHERILPVERHAVQKKNALWIDEHADIALEFEDQVSRTRFRGELELIAKAGAAAPQNAQPQTALHTLALESGAYLRNRFRRNVYRFRRSIGGRGLRLGCSKLSQLGHLQLRRNSFLLQRSRLRLVVADCRFDGIFREH